MAIIENPLVLKGLTIKMIEEGCELATSAKMAKLLLIYQCKVNLKNCFSFTNVRLSFLNLEFLIVLRRSRVFLFLICSCHFCVEDVIC